MNPLHSLLKRQLRRFTAETIPLMEGQTNFLRAINEAYWQFDEDRRMLEHSLELTSQELLEKNAELSGINTDLEQRVMARTVELSRSEARFRGLFEDAPISIWEEDYSAVRQSIDDLRAAGVVDFSAYFDEHPEEVAACVARVRIVDVNLATLEMFQAENKAQLLAHLSNVLGPESLDPFKVELLALARGETSFENETFNYTLQGERREVFLRLNVAPGYEQTWAKVFVSISDITERRQAEKALQEAETKYRTLVEHMPAVVYVDLADESRNTIYINSQIQDLLGYSPEDWITKPDLCTDIVHPEDSERMWKELDESEARGRFACDYRYIAKDGHIVWVRDEAVLIKNEEERPSVWQGVMLDITAQKEAEEALRKSEERFKVMAWATQDAMWDWDLRTNQIWWGEGLQKVFHYSSETAPPDPQWRLEGIHPDDRDKVKRAIDQALEGGMEFWSKEYRFRRKDETYADIMDRGYILRDESGKPYRMIGAMLDITERKLMESTLRQANEQMQQILNELQLRNGEIVLLNEMGRYLQACQTVEEAYQIIADLSNLLFPQTTGALYLLNASRTSVSAVTSWGDLPAAEQMFAPNDCWGLRHGRTHPLNEGQEGLQCLHLSEPLPAVSYCLPVQIHGEIQGILHIRSQQKENLEVAKFQLAYTVVEQTGMALSNLNLRAALREQSIRDPVTGLHNRRYMEEALKQHLSRVTRHLHPLGIIMIDIDHFKNFNDLHGHAAGDRILRELGKFLQSHIRGEDTACRYGGEEFILILPDVFLEAARNRAEQLRREAKELRVEDDGQSYAGITLSMGVALYPLHGRTIENALRAADSALYRAKQEGRDQVVIADTAH